MKLINNHLNWMYLIAIVSWITIAEVWSDSSLAAIIGFVLYVSIITYILNRKGRAYFWVIIPIMAVLLENKRVNNG